jgi:hypothetical protein
MNLIVKRSNDDPSLTRRGSGPTNPGLCGQDAARNLRIASLSAQEAVWGLRIPSLSGQDAVRSLRVAILGGQDVTRTTTDRGPERTGPGSKLTNRDPERTGPGSKLTNRDPERTGRDSKTTNPRPERTRRTWERPRRVSSCCETRPLLANARSGRTSSALGLPGRQAARPDVAPKLTNRDPERTRRERYDRVRTLERPDSVIRSASSPSRCTASE